MDQKYQCQLDLISSELNIKINQEKEALIRKNKQLTELRKHATMGKMVGAIAHQWRQPLSTLKISLQNLEMAAETGELTMDIIKSIVSEGGTQIDYLSDTITAFQKFSKPDKEKITFNLFGALTESLFLLKSQLDHNFIRCTLEDVDPSVMLYGYPNEFKQAIVSIITNAKEAIQDARELGDLSESGGFIEVSGRQHDQTVVIEIFNAGSQINPEHVKQIFESGHTTKRDGTGIGLNIVKMVVEGQMEGRCKASNKQDGVSFYLTLPAVENRRLF